MGRFSRSIKRGVARGEGKLIPKGTQVKRMKQERRLMRRIFCPKCNKVIDDMLAVRSVPAPAPGAEGRTEMHCKECDTPVVLKMWEELPAGTLARGLWVKLDKVSAIGPDAVQ